MAPRRSLGQLDQDRFFRLFSFLHFQPRHHQRVPAVRVETCIADTLLAIQLFHPEDSRLEHSLVRDVLKDVDLALVAEKMQKLVNSNYINRL